MRWIKLGGERGWMIEGLRKRHVEVYPCLDGHWAAVISLRRGGYADTYHDDFDAARAFVEKALCQGTFPLATDG